MVTLLTWILPVTYFSGELVQAERAQAGIISVGSYGLFTFYKAVLS